MDERRRVIKYQFDKGCFNLSFSDMMETFVVAMHDADQFLSFLHSLSDMGAAMRKVITKTVTNPEIYENLTSGIYNYVEIL